MSARLKEAALLAGAYLQRWVCRPPGPRASQRDLAQAIVALVDSGAPLDAVAYFIAVGAVALAAEDDARVGLGSGELRRLFRDARNMHDGALGRIL